MYGISLTAQTGWQAGGCYDKSCQQTVVNLCLLPLKACMHISYIENESKHRAFSEPKFYPEFWVIAMGIGKAGSKVKYSKQTNALARVFKNSKIMSALEILKLNFMRKMHHVQTNP